MFKIKIISDATFNTNLDKPMNAGPIKRYSEGEVLEIHDSWLKFLSRFPDKVKVLEEKTEKKKPSAEGKKKVVKDDNKRGSAKKS